MFSGPNGAGKGDKPRGMKISRKEFEERWDKIFNHKGLEKNIFKKENNQEGNNNGNRSK
tara:strand:+ start:423 stop:599 length:177 start_codon:yes stop_codon:yes gene_type:complete